MDLAEEEYIQCDEEISFRLDHRDHRSPGPSPRETGHGDAAHVYNRSRRQQLRPEIFNGDNSWEEYFKVFSTISRVNGWTKEEQADYLFTHLRGAARQLACTLSEEELRDIDHLVTVLGNRFGPGGQAELYLAELRGRRRHDKEGLRELGQAIRKLSTMAYPGISAAHQDRLAKIHFIDALEDYKMRMFVQQGNLENLQEAVTSALEMEGYWRIEDHRENNINPLRRRTGTRNFRCFKRRRIETKN